MCVHFNKEIIELIVNYRSRNLTKIYKKLNRRVSVIFLSYQENDEIENSGVCNTLYTLDIYQTVKDHMSESDNFLRQ